MSSSLPESDRLHWLQTCIDWLQGIGMEVEATALAAGECFLPGVRITAGRLQVDLATAFPGDLLHEASHLAVLPTALRPYADGDLRGVERISCAYLGAHPEWAGYPEDQFCRALMQCSESESTAWQYSAACATGLPDEWLFPAGSFSGDSQAVLDGLRANMHPGINGLQAAGWTKRRAVYRLDAPTYPQLAFWFHPAKPRLGPIEEVLAAGLLLHSDPT